MTPQEQKVLKLALEALENNRQTHYYCEDTWYSCPKHEDGCANESNGDECNCGADKKNAEIDKAITAIKEALSTKCAAQPEQEPIVWKDQQGNVRMTIDSEEIQSSVGPEQEPMAHVDHRIHGWPECFVMQADPPFTSPVYTTPPQRKPKFKEFIEWAGSEGYDCAQTCNSDTGEWICLNPMTADLWKAWQAAHGITGEQK